MSEGMVGLFRDMDIIKGVLCVGGYYIVGGVSVWEKGCDLNCIKQEKIIEESREAIWIVFLSSLKFQKPSWIVDTATTNLLFVLLISSLQHEGFTNQKRARQAPAISHKWCFIKFDIRNSILP